MTLGIALYAALAGASAGVVRAAIMGGLGVFAAQVGRRQYGLNSLAFVAALMVLADPKVILALEGRTLLRTDQNGWVKLSTDGEQMWVEAAR